MEKGTIFYATGDIREVTAESGKWTLEELQAAVGGDIELVPGSAPCAFCNESGLLSGLQENEYASLRFRTELVGNVIQVDRAFELRDKG